MDFALQKVDFVLKMMDFALKMMDRTLPFKVKVVPEDYPVYCERFPSSSTFSSISWGLKCGRRRRKYGLKLKEIEGNWRKLKDTAHNPPRLRTSSRLFSRLFSRFGSNLTQFPWNCQVTICGFLALCLLRGICLLYITKATVST